MFLTYNKCKYQNYVECCTKLGLGAAYLQEQCPSVSTINKSTCNDRLGALNVLSQEIISFFNALHLQTYFNINKLKGKCIFMS